MNTILRRIVVHTSLQEMTLSLKAFSNMCHRARAGIAVSTKERRESASPRSSCKLGHPVKTAMRLNKQLQIFANLALSAAT